MRTSIISVIEVRIKLTVRLGIFAFIPDGLEFGEYNKFYSPYTLIQKSSMRIVRFDKQPQKR